MTLMTGKIIQRADSETAGAGSIMITAALLQLMTVAMDHTADMTVMDGLGMTTVPRLIIP